MPFFFIDHNGLKHPSDKLWEYYGIKDPERGQPTNLSLRQNQGQPEFQHGGFISETSEKKEICAQEIMSTPVITVFEDQKLQDAITKFGQNNFRHLPVISRQGGLVGLLSERDIINQLHHNPIQSSAEFLQKPLGNIMQRTVLTVSGDTELQYIINLMRYESVGSLPVLGQALSSLSHGLPSTAAIVGIITKTNLLSLEIS